MLLDSVKGDTKRVATKALGESQRIHSVLSEWREPGDHGRVYEKQNPKLKCMLQLNSRNPKEYKFLKELDEYKFSQRIGCVLPRFVSPGIGKSEKKVQSLKYCTGVTARHIETSFEWHKTPRKAVDGHAISHTISRSDT